MSDDNVQLKTTLDVVKETGFIAIRTLVTLNGSAFLALLTFVANVSFSQDFEIDIVSLKAALSFFLLGLLAVLSSLAVAYITAQLGLLGKWVGSARRVISLQVACPALSTLFFTVGVIFSILGI